MSDNVIYADFGVSGGLSYITEDDEYSDKKIFNGCSINSGDISLVKDGDLFAIESLGIEISREEMATFLWMAAYFIDSEQRYASDELIGLNYEKEGNKDE